MSALRINTAPQVEPVEIEEAKEHLRVDHQEDNELIEYMITAARGQIEASLNRALIEQIWDLELDCFPRGDVIELPKGRVSAVSSFAYLDEDKSPTAVSTDVYDTDFNSEPGAIFLKPNQQWPSATLYSRGAVQITFTAGYGGASTDVPEDIRRALLLMVGTLYENRAEMVIGQGVTVVSIPAAVEALLANHRVWAF